MKNKKGITLIALTTMIVLITIIMSSITYVSLNAIEMKKSNEIKADLRILTDKVEEYYLQSGVLPTKGNAMKISSGDPTTTAKIGAEELAKKNKFDNSDYYLINYQLLDRVVLNDSDRAYVVNDKTHTVYVLGGYNTSVGKEFYLPYVNDINNLEN